MKIPKHIWELRRAVESYCGTALDHDDYVNHGSPQESIEGALLRFNDAKDKFLKALAACAAEEGVTK